MRNDTPFVDAVPNGALEEIAAVQEDGVGLFLADGPRLVDETRVSAEALASSCLRIGASAAVFVGLLETTVDVVGVQDGQIECRHGIHQRHQVQADHFQLLKQTSDFQLESSSRKMTAETESD